jgi:hypothetical protein
MATVNRHAAQSNWKSAGSGTETGWEKREATHMGARLLILTGIVIQLAILGFGLLGHGTVLLVSGLAGGVWNILASLWSVPLASGLAECWPLLLVVAGLALLWSTKRDGAQVVSARQMGDGNGE